jgi:hypothetical protein
LFSVWKPIGKSRFLGRRVVVDERRILLGEHGTMRGDLAEYLFCKAFGWKQAGNSHANVDAIAPDGTRYQIKGRRITRYNNSRQLSAIRDLPGSHFDFLAGVLFGEDYAVMRAALVPHAVAIDCATFVQRTNSHRFLLRDNVWNIPGVRDVTAQLRAVTF